MKFLFLILMLFMVGCAHSVHIVGFSDYRPYTNSGTIVKSETKQFVIFWFTDNTQYVDLAYQKLMQQCPGGSITGIGTKFYTNLGFFSWTNKLEMQGYCIKN
jgi:hypothetical protein